MLNYSFFDSVIGPDGQPDRAFGAGDFSKYFGTLIKNGIFPNPSSNFQIMGDQENMTVKAEPGLAWIEGHLGYDDGVFILNIDKADSALDRIDRIVLRLDTLERCIKWVVKKGDLSSSPVAKSLQRDADAYEIAIADVRVGKGASKITQSAITDLRMNTELCGWVTGVVNQIDTTTLFNQMEQWKAEYIANTNNWTSTQEQEFLNWRKFFEKTATNWRSGEEEKFNDWLKSIKDKLNGDTAGNLQSQIDKLIEKDKKLETEDVRLENSKLNTPQYVEYTMLANRWSGNSYSFEQEYPFSKYTITVLGAIDKTTSEQIEALGNASLASVLTNQTVVAKDLIPKIDIIVGIEVVMKNGIS